MIHCIITVLAIFFISGLLTAATFFAWLQNEKKSNYSTRVKLLSGFIVGPVLFSFFFSVFIYLFPKNSDGFYLVLFLILIIAAGWFLKKFIAEVFVAFISEIKAVLLFNSTTKILFSILSIVFFAHLFIQAVAQPIVGHDALVFAYYGERIYKEKSFENYPVKNNSNLSVYHLPGFSALYASTNLFYNKHLLKNELNASDSKDTPALEASKNIDLPYRLISPLYGILLLFLLYTIIEKRCGKKAAFLSTSCLYMMPYYYYQTLGNTIDPIRISLLIIILILLSRFLRNESLRNLIMLIASCLLSFYIHQSTILIIAVTVAVIVLFSKRIKYKKSLIAIFILLFGMLQLLIWTDDNNGGQKLKRLKYLLSLKPNKVSDSRSRFIAAFGKEWADKVHNGEVSFLQRIWHERVQTLSRPKIFGFVFYLGLLGIAVWFLFMRKIQADYLILTFVLLFSLPVLFKYYINYRYIGTIFPAFIYFSAFFIRYLIFKINKISPIITGIAINGIFSSAIVLFVLILSIPLCDKGVYNLLPGAGYLEKFATWKSYAHPLGNISALYSNKINGCKILLNKRDIAFFYYFPDSPILLRPRLKQQILENGLYRALLDHNVDYIIDDKSNDFLTGQIADEKLLYKIDSYRNITLYSVKNVK